MQYFKLQMGCMLVLLYIAFVYWKERGKYHKKHKRRIFDYLLTIGIVSILFDGITAYTVNHPDTVNATLNMLCHLFFLLGLDTFIFILFLYMRAITEGIPKPRKLGLLVYLPYLLNVIVVVLFIPTLQYRKGEISNYSMGISAYTCFIMAGVYIVLSWITFVGRWKYIERHKRFGIFSYLAVLGVLTLLQMIYPQILTSSIALTIIVIGGYINQENPAIEELSCYQREMVMGFATLVETKDGSTGGHIRRTSLYVKLLAEELRQNGFYKDVLTKDYINHLCQAAPMHDIGKIAVPDVILQKPGKLTDEEFTIMKQHAAKGGEIIRQTFGHLENKEYTQMAYEVARYHHEKWNGNGYPEGLKGKEIPLCARIMAIADVFDAVSMKRCYREAMPLNQCFEIIEKGSGQDFEPLLVEVFLDIREKVEAAHNEVNRESQEDEKCQVEMGY